MRSGSHHRGRGARRGHDDHRETGGRHGHHDHPHHRGEHGEWSERGERGRGQRRRRLFDAAELQLLLLSLASEQPAHGYELIRGIEARSHGGYSPSPGVVYPALTFMEEAGLLEAVQEGARKNYRATAEGEARIADEADTVAALQARLTSMAAMRERTDAAPVRRAMQNLKTAIFDRLSQDRVDRETVLRVAELIDDAARKIERIDV